MPEHSCHSLYSTNIVSAYFVLWFIIECILYLQIPPGFEVNEEIELGVIISKNCKNVTEKDAMDFVAGYCVALDLTATSELVNPFKLHKFISESSAEIKSLAQFHFE